jgi:hypothetical protein
MLIDSYLKYFSEKLKCKETKCIYVTWSCINTWNDAEWWSQYIWQCTCAKDNISGILSQYCLYGFIAN